MQPLENFKLASNAVRHPTGRLGVSNPEKRVGQTGLGIQGPEDVKEAVSGG